MHPHRDAVILFVCFGLPVPNLNILQCLHGQIFLYYGISSYIPVCVIWQTQKFSNLQIFPFSPLRSMKCGQQEV